MFDDNATNLASFLRFATVVTIAMMASVGIYVALATFLVGSEDAPERLAGTLPSLLPAALVVVAALLVAAAQVLHRLQLGRLRAAADAVSALAEYRKVHLVSLALSESAAIFGLVLTLLYGDLRWCFGFAAVALASMAVLWPSRGRLAALLSPVERAPIEPS